MRHATGQDFQAAIIFPLENPEMSLTSFVGFPLAANSVWLSLAAFNRCTA